MNKQPKVSPLAQIAEAAPTAGATWDNALKPPLQELAMLVHPCAFTVSGNTKLVTKESQHGKVEL